MTQQGWPDRVAATVAGAVRHYRELRGLSAQQLADECARLGVPIQRSVIANFENGRRTSIGVAEIFVFAAVLQVPPVELMAATGLQRQIEILPGESEDAYMAAAWISGESSRENSEDPTELPYFQTPYQTGRGLIEIAQIMLARSVEIAEAKAASEAGRGRVAMLKDSVDHLQAVYEEQRAMASEAMEESKGDGSPRSRNKLDEAIQLHEAAGETLRALHAAEMEHANAAKADYELDYLMKEQAVDERDAWELVAVMRDRGWELPELPPEMSFLAEEVKSPRRRVRGKRRG